MKYIQVLIILFVTIAIVTSVNAQRADSLQAPPKPLSDSLPVKNTVYCSFGGGGVFFSLNYERHLIVHHQYTWGVKGGLATSFSSVLFPSEFSIPLGSYFLYGKKNSHLDLSFSLTSYLLQQYDHNKDENYKELKLLCTPSVAYRYQKKSGGFTARFGFSPIIYFNSIRHSVMPWIDISIGWTF